MSNKRPDYVIDISLEPQSSTKVAVFETNSVAASGCILSSEATIRTIIVSSPVSNYVYVPFDAVQEQSRKANREANLPPVIGESFAIA